MVLNATFNMINSNIDGNILTNSVDTHNKRIAIKKRVAPTLQPITVFVLRCRLGVLQARLRNNRMCNM